jgi:hypothetical protein
MDPSGNPSAAATLSRSGVLEVNSFRGGTEQRITATQTSNALSNVAAISFNPSLVARASRTAKSCSKSRRALKS